ncbi:GGDEF domain-containing protein [Algiphilus sp.]|uniref:GGDEF domain-containing protein n=1 Tax=Algiphilus sp. TaxID=1872431 RepID=UPI0025C145B3|nr:GGDEF domain-containing protein [Algiphilus sp.]MCK5771790.1 GGDEF domain-containing protein [Algiphilus sp.]
MLRIEDLDEAGRTLKRRLRFPPAIEAMFRDAQEARHRVPRILFFSVIAVAFALAPLYNDLVLRVSPEARPLVLAIELVWGLPAMALSALASWRDWPDPITQPVQTYGVLSLWGVVLSLQALGYAGQVAYPTHLVALAVIAVATFGGYRTRRFVLGATTVLALDLLMLIGFGAAEQTIAHRTYEMVFVWLIAIGGAVTTDMLTRALWLRHCEAWVLSRTDQLTGLLNRGTFFAELDRLLAQARRDGTAIGIALIDLDHFKHINDRFGHLAGDDIIRASGRMIAERLARRPLDLRARYGGEEFAVAWYDIDSRHFGELLDQVRTTLGTIAHHGEDGDTHRVTASIGGVCVVPQPSTRTLALIEQADALLYRAKDAGRDRVAWRDLGEPRTLAAGA